jgi:hypothetical protein
MTADLHLHTFHSDGSWSPQQLVEAAIEQGLACIAVTDHDTVDGIAPTRRAAAATNLEVIAGIEINTVQPPSAQQESTDVQSLESKEPIDIHLLGYFIDPQNEVLAKLMRKQQDARQQLVDDTIARCRSLGINLTRSLVEECAGHGSIGRPHLAKAIVAAGGADDVCDAFERFMMRSSPDYIERRSATPEEAIKAIVAAGGIASLAHPGKNSRMELIIERLQKVGLRAVEAYHRSHSLDLVKHYLHLAAKRNLLVTGGSDCHGPSDKYPASIGSVKVPLDVVAALKAGATLQSVS